MDQTLTRGLLCSLTHTHKKKHPISQKELNVMLKGSCVEDLLRKVGMSCPSVLLLLLFIIFCKQFQGRVFKKKKKKSFEIQASLYYNIKTVFVQCLCFFYILLRYALCPWKDYMVQWVHTHLFKWLGLVPALSGFHRRRTFLRSSTLLSLGSKALYWMRQWLVFWDCLLSSLSYQE